MKVSSQPGKLGQFDVVVDGEVIARRGDGGLLNRLFGGGWPDPQDVIAKIEAIIARQRSG